VRLVVKGKRKVVDLSLLDLLDTQMIQKPWRSTSENCRKRGKRCTQTGINWSVSNLIATFSESKRCATLGQIRDRKKPSSCTLSSISHYM
jgi:hypothetical protein